MKKLNSFFLLFLSFLFIVTFSAAQTGEWVWMKGSSTPNAAQNLGTQNVQLTSNEPPSVYEPCEWRDTSGNFWIFGGKDTTGNFHGDLWRYIPGTNDWTWMKGSGNVSDPGNYGAKGIPSGSTYPPSIGFGVPTWVDLDNNLWMFGGGSGGGNFSDDLWRYTISTNEWTWMKGKDSTLVPPVYGTLGVPDPANTPGFREETAATWTDAAGDLWLFGGLNYYGSQNDLWRFNIATNSWTWMKGGVPKQGYLFGNYGTEGVETSTNVPGGRYVYSHWKDNSGNFWLFGGYDGLGSHYNDMWRYNPATNNWTWMSGTDILYVQGSSGSKCTFSSSNVPFSRMENRACWTDPNGNFWLYGGAVDSAGRFSIAWNDLWKYCVQTNQWVWISGDSTGNATGNWGFKGVPNPANVPNGRAGAVGWSDMKGHFYIFGGTTSPFGDMYNDVWKYYVDSNCVACASAVLPVASFLSSDTVLCQYDCINYTNLSSGATSWSWSFPGAIPSSSTDENPQGVCYLSTGAFDVTLIASNGFGKDSVTVSNFIQVFPSPPTPSINASNDTLFCTTDTSYSSFQWYSDTTLIPGATDSSLVITQGGQYNVKVTNKEGCSIAVGINIILGLSQPPGQAVNTISLSPNPAKDELLISGVLSKENYSVRIYNVLGQQVGEENISKGDNTSVNIKFIPAGVYFVRLLNKDTQWIGRFIKE